MSVGILVALVGIGAVAVGAILTGVFALWTAWLSERRQHERWKRTERLAAYVDYLRHVDQTMLAILTNQTPKTHTQILGALQPIVDAIANVVILGPESVIDAADALRMEVATSIPLGKASPDFARARSAYVIAVRTAIGIDPEAEQAKNRHQNF